MNHFSTELEKLALLQGTLRQKLDYNSVVT